MHEEDVTTKVFVATTHTPVLFFSSKGQVYKLKVYKLPLGSPQSKGRSLVNIFPIDSDETINVVMPLPDDENKWDDLGIMFATSKGTVRRNDLSDFKRIPSNGKIAMKLDEDSRLVAVNVCDESQHVFLSTRDGKSVRFPVSAVREFKSRASTGVRAVKLADANEVVSMDIITGVEFEDIDQRDQYLKIPLEDRLSLKAFLNPGVDEDGNALEIDEEAVLDQLNAIESPLHADQVRHYAANEDFILAITENGYGKRTSAYEYRVTNRGGSGVVNIVTSARNGKVVASYKVELTDQILLITTKGKLIRCPLSDVRVTGRSTQGVTLFKVADGEKVISAARIEDADDDQDDQEQAQD